MNPGGDFGKKELSPALRNRFTEIWVEPITTYHNIMNAQQEVKDMLTQIFQNRHKRQGSSRAGIVSRLAQGTQDILTYYNGEFCRENNMLNKQLTLRDVNSIADFTYISEHWLFNFIQAIRMHTVDVLGFQGVEGEHLRNL